MLGGFVGQYFKIVNPAKRQYIDPSSFNENPKASGLLYGYHALAVALLVVTPKRYAMIMARWLAPGMTIR